ncbi:MAG: DNA gyrase subunit A [Parcubacteria group bacterium]
MEIGHIKSRKIVEEMQESYLDYAMSVIVQRALPDVRDGLKPVHRRILYAMWDIGLKSTHRFRKSATVVGEVLGKYHPHGDVAVYESMVRMAQDFSMRYPLVDGQGNFGSMDGDSAAAMRYTEARLTKIAEEMLSDIEKETVDFADNFDRSLKEPRVLPAKLPNTLLNGAVGIAVGMATNIPPHNLGEIISGVVELIDHPESTVEDLMQHVKGPDFPTGGIIFNQKEITQVYATGRGGIVMRAKTNITEHKKGQFQIIVNEIPFQVNKATLIEKIADLVKNKKVDGIKDLRDESDRDGVRIVIDLKKEAFPKKTLNRLFKLTQLQDKFHVNMLALVDGIQPKVLTLKAVLEHYIKHRQEVIKRRTQFDLTRAKERAHILEGLKKALDHINEIIKTIRASKNKEEAHKNLIKKFKFSPEQAGAILEMKLSQLAALERKKIEDELEEKKALIKELETLLKSSQKILTVIKDELQEIREKFADERKTRVMASAVDDFAPEDLVPKEKVIITLTEGGYIKSLPETTYKTQSRGGKGVIGMVTKEEDIVKHFFATNTLSDLLFFTNQGRVFQLKAYEIPKTTRTTKGQSIANFLQLAADERVTALVSSDKFKEAKFLVMVTKGGVVKKSHIEDFAKVRKSGLIALRLKKEDELKWVEPTSGQDEVIIITAQGLAIRFSEGDIRPMGRTAAGVAGIRFKKEDDQTIGMDIITTAAKDNELLIVTKKGYGKRTALDKYRLQRRSGTGITTAKISARNGEVILGEIVDENKKEIIIISRRGQVIRTTLKQISQQGRATQGVRVMKLQSGDEVASLTII